MLYATSSPVAEETVAYYLSLLPRAVRRSARARLTLVAAHDASLRPLAAKLLDRPRLLTRIRWAVRDRELCHLAPYTSTELERELALELDIPMYAADPRHAHLGTKSGARRLFARAGVPHPLGVEDVASADDVIRAIARLRAARPGVAEVVVKHDDGVSGAGNAIVDLRGLPAPGAAGERELIAARVARMALEADGVSVAAYLERLARGGIVEERIAGGEVRSPSAQLELTPAGHVEMVSTHDQVLGGHSGQSYLGCRFPAEPACAGAITELACRVGARLAGEGVVGRCAIDFVAVRGDGGRWEPHAIEINLRKGGTTHPLATLELLTGGRYDAATARFATPAGGLRQYVATDHLRGARARTARPGRAARPRGRPPRAALRPGARPRDRPPHAQRPPARPPRPDGRRRLRGGRRAALRARRGAPAGGGRARHPRRRLRTAPSSLAAMVHVIGPRVHGHGLVDTSVRRSQTRCASSGSRRSCSPRRPSSTRSSCDHAGERAHRHGSRPAPRRPLDWGAMRFDLPDDHRLLQETVRDFARQEIAPVAEELDRDKRFPYEIVAQMGELGWMGIPFPEEVGGAGGDSLGYALAVEELTRVDSSVAITMCAHTSLGTQPIHLFGSDEQRERLLPDLCAGRRLGAFGLTEPEAGTDAGNTRTRARRENGGWIVDGAKQFITNAGTEISGHVAITARTGEEEISNLIVENGTPGYEQGTPYRKMGWNASDTRPLTFTDCHVPEENLLGPRGQGFKQFLHILDIGRIGVAAMGVGLAQGALDQALDYARERRAFGRPISKFQAIQAKLADLSSRARGRPTAHLQGRVAQGRGPAVHAHRRPGQAQDGATRGPRRRGGGADPRRLRLHRGVPRLPLLPRREDPHDRRRDRRGPADGHRAGPRRLRPSGPSRARGARTVSLDAASYAM